MRIEELDYNLPAERIAQRPLTERDASRLLLLDRGSGAIADRAFRELPALVRGEELVVLNNARVFPARLVGERRGVRAQPVSKKNPARREHLRAPIEALLLRCVEGDTWEALVRPGRKVGIGEVLRFGGGELEGEVLARAPYGRRTIRFRCDGDLRTTVERLGHVPLPPYIERADEPADRERYQTVFARAEGAVAAPTAGLHFTPEILAALRARGCEIVELTLRVGYGTFQPIRSATLEAHRMEPEEYEIPPATAAAIARARAARRPVLAVGTTVVRALEDAAGSSGAVAPGRGAAQLFITPGFSFRVVDQLLTNFHLPRSSLLALVAAFAGRENIRRAYRHAVAQGYRFYSYGDCMLIR